MLRALEIKNFTVFEEAKIEFSPGLNVVIGENGTGKSHLLKLGYCMMQISFESKGSESRPIDQQKIADHLISVFNAEKLSSLISYQKNPCNIKTFFESESKVGIDFDFGSHQTLVGHLPCL